MRYDYAYYPDGSLHEKKASGKTLLGFQYDLNGNRTLQRDITGKETRYTYNALDLLEEVRDNGFSARYAYHGNGNRTSKESLAGKTSYQYDSLNRLVKVQYPKGLEEFSYDRADNRIRRLTEKEEELYKYDVCNRLIEKQTRRLTDSRAGVTAETGRKLDNRAGMSTNPGSGLNPDNAGTTAPQRTKEMEDRTQAAIRKPVNTNTDNIIPFRTSTFQYDSQGNLLREERKTEGNRQESIYSYDGFNRQKKIVNFESKVQVNHYDGEGLRHEMEENGKLVKFLYNDREAVAEEKEDGNTIRYIRGYDLVASDSESARTYYHYASDEQGSITHVLGKDGNGNYGLRNYYEYGAFGDFREKAEDVENRFGYNGEIFDPIGGQYYLRARYYNPVIGRFTQEDTYYGDGLNLYAYCSNLPVGYEDPSGHVAHAICDAKAKKLEEKEKNGTLTKEEYQELRRYRRAKDNEYYQQERQTGKSSRELYNEQHPKKSGSNSPTPNSGQGFSPKGYNPQPGERTFEGYVNKNVPRDVETKLFTHSNDFNTNPKNDGHFKRFGTEPNQHGIAGAHVHQPTRNVNPNNGMITGKPGSKTKNGGVTEPGAKDVKQLYEYLENGKYH